MTPAPDSATAPHTSRERAVMLVNELTEQQTLAVHTREWLIAAIVRLANAACKDAVADERAAIRQLLSDLSPAHRTAWVWRLLALAAIDHRSEGEK